MRPLINHDDYVNQRDTLKNDRDLFAFFLFDPRSTHRAVEEFANDQYEWLDALAEAAGIYFFMFFAGDRPLWVSGESTPSTYRSRLHAILVERFDEEELRTLIFHLGVNYDDLPARTRNGRARELITMLEREGRLAELVDYCKRNRPDILRAELPDAEAANVKVPSSRPAIKNPSPMVAREFGIKVSQLPGIVLFTLDADKAEFSSGVYFPLKKKLFEADRLEAENAIADLFDMIQECQDASANPQETLIRLRAMIEESTKAGNERLSIKYLRQAIESLASGPRTLDEALKPAFEF